MNPGTQEKVQELAIELAEELGEGFSVFAATGYVVVGHPALGLAAVVIGEEEAALLAAESLNEVAERAGAPYPSMHFAISDHGSPPWIVTRSSMGGDILRGMALAAAQRPPLGEEALAKIAVTLAELPSRQDTPEVLDWRIMRTIEACVERALAGRPAFIEGIEINAADVAGPKFLLPAIMVSAARRWTIPVIASEGAGGFLVRLKRDEGAILGYRVSDIEMSSPLLLFLPIVNLVRATSVGAECVFDTVVKDFEKFLKENKYNASGIDELDVRVATSV